MRLGLRLLEFEEGREAQRLGRNLVTRRIRHILKIGRSRVRMVKARLRLHHGAQTLFELFDAITRGAAQNDWLDARLLDKAREILLRRRVIDLVGDDQRRTGRKLG